ncbi:MAG: hypothetical protein Q9227_002620 [Pyrenula ochraceoflavens]
MTHTPITTHHHRSTTKTTHKPFKPRFTSKGSLRDQAKGKIEDRKQDRGNRRTPQQQAMSKIARKNQARQHRIHHHEKKERESKLFRGVEGAPRHLAMIPLSVEADSRKAISKLNESVDVDAEIPSTGTVRVKVDRFRRNLLYLPSSMELLQALDVCRLADWVILVISAQQRFHEGTDLLLRSIEGQGITNVVAVVQDVDQRPGANKKPKAITEIKDYLGRFFSDLERIHIIDNKSDCSNLVRTLCTASSRGIRWRDQRSWMLIEKIEQHARDEAEAIADVTVTGIIRGTGLNPDRLAHIPGWGDFQISKIVEETTNKPRSADVDGMQDIPTTHLPTTDQDDLSNMAPEEVEMTDAASTTAATEHKGVLLDDHHYFSDDNSYIPPPPKKLPKGTSAYQAAWYLDDVSDSESDIVDEENYNEDVVMEVAGPEDQEIDAKPAEGDTMTDVAPSEYFESEMHVEKTKEQEAQDLEDFRSSRKKEAEEDRDFPDEIELHPNVLARERLAKYRGLKSFRTSDWNTAEDASYEPAEYQKLLKIANYKNSNKQAFKEALIAGVAPGTRVEVTLAKVPLALQQTRTPTSLFSLLRHEHKSTVVNLNIVLNSSVEEPLKSKEELIIQIGPRRFTIEPLYSTAGTTPNDVHKFHRFLHPGDSAIATYIGPLTWGSNPALVFKRVGNLSNTGHTSLRLIGSATTIAPSQSRVIAKRIILTGHPYKINRKLVTVRYMFFNKEDVAWFSALPLWTKRGRHGFIKESLGTHGYFKATFDGRINPMDAVAVSLYKRMWPRVARLWEGH